ncbi:MAG: hypothetical protein J7M08_06395 [Planctomycetes bacterium]|nr:hypothetical protein [Planctomycetota bacterium]
MLSPLEMRKVNIFVLGREEERVARALGAMGIVHLRSSVEESGGVLSPKDLEGELSNYQSLLERIERLQEALGLQVRANGALWQRELPAMGEVEQLVEALEGKTSERREELAKVREALDETRDLVEWLQPYKEMESSLKQLEDSDFLAVTAGKATAAELDLLRANAPRGVMIVPLGPEPAPGRPRTALIICGRRRRFAVQTVLGEHEFEQTDIPAWDERTPADVYAETLGKASALGERARALEQALQDVGEACEETLGLARTAVLMQSELCRARRYFGATWATTLISGWVPATKTRQLHERLRELTGGRCVVRVSAPTDEEIERDQVPTEVKHSPLLAPFERLVQGFDVPSYAEIEPTLLFAISFLLMFGLMFGDLGHGLCLVVVGLLVKRRAARAPVRDIGHVILIAGVASALFGTFFQGSFFGKSLLKWGFPLSLGLEPMRFEGGDAGGQVTRYMLLAVGVGVALISLGAVLNIINRLRRGDVAEGLLGRFGVVGVMFYWGGLAWMIKLLLAGSGRSDPWIVLPAIALPLLILMAHRPVRALLGRGKGEEGDLMMGLFHGLIEGMETVMVYLANTFSFLRVAAFALSHAALCFTIFVLIGLVNALPGGIIWSAIVFAIGTAVLIALEGLIVTIQILRLEYYEFFTKFFHGQGVRYDPFRWKLEDRLES